MWRASSDSSIDWDSLGVCDTSGGHRGRCRFSDVYSNSGSQKSGNKEAGDTSDESGAESSPDEAEIAAELGVCHTTKVGGDIKSPLNSPFVRRAHESKRESGRRASPAQAGEDYTGGGETSG